MTEMGYIVGILANLTVRTPFDYFGTDYDCNVLGDGQVQHFGNISPESENFSTVHVYCTLIRAKEEEDLIQQEE